MKYAIRNILSLLLGALLMAGCSKTKIIPDKDLERITREMFLVNAYATAQRIDTDSMDIYTPILQRYGYTQEDLFNTFANFQKRKSARLSDVIEASIASLEGLSSGYERKVRNLRYIDSLAKAACKEEILFVEQVKVTRMKDTARLRYSLPVRDYGEYEVSYTYYIDSLDKNNRLQSSQEIYDSKGGRNHLVRNNLVREKRTTYTTTLTPKEGSVRYELLLADYARREDEPNITFDSLRIVYFPPTEVALRRMDSTLRFRPQLYFNDTIRARGYLDAIIPRLPHDTVWVALDSIELAEAQTLRLRADSLSTVADKESEESDKLLQRGEKLRGAAAKKWYRNDSLREVAHRKNVAEAEALSLKADSLSRRATQLLIEATEVRERADSIDRVILGEPRENTTTTKETTKK